MKIETLSLQDQVTTGISAGCTVTKPSLGALDTFEIRCDGYVCPDCPEFESIGRTDPQRRDYLQNEVQFNVLMNDVLLAPDNYVRQDFANETVVGTQSLSQDNLIALIRARTALGTWYEECFYDFFKKIFWNCTKFRSISFLACFFVPCFMQNQA